MNTKTTRRLLLAVALSGAVLTGCVPAGTTGTATGGCDPNGFGPFSGCGDTSSSTEQAAEPVSSTDGCDPNGFGPFSGCTGTEQQDTPSQDEPDRDQGLTPTDGVSRADLKKAAEHEAGHKLVADEYGWQVMSAVIRPDGSGQVYVFGLRLKDPQQRLALYYAGAIACGDESTGYGTNETKGDFDYAEEILDRYPVDEANRMEEAARAEAARIVAEGSDQIDRDAADLLDDGRLS